MPVLLCSLGTSWLVVPEAFYFLPPGPAGFSAVHVLTTASPRIDVPVAEVKAWFASHARQTTLTVSRVAAFTDLLTEDDHQRFEEVLFRWILAVAPDRAERHLCIAGGFKTMSASMQRAASLFGAAEVFHVLAPESVRDTAAFTAALTAGEIRPIRLGAEAGWPQLAALVSRDFPLQAPGPDLVSAPDRHLTHRIAHLQAAQQNLAKHFADIAHLPFPSLATRSPAQLAWLREPVQPTGDRAWIAALPKIELHCHLGGYATHDPELATIRAAAHHPAALPPLAPCTPPTPWPLSTLPNLPPGSALKAYMVLGDNNGSRLLRDPGCLRAQCESLFAALAVDHVAYAEIRCSPHNYTNDRRSAFHVLTEIREHFQRCMANSAALRPDQQAACHVNLIIIATRKDGGDFRAAIHRHLMLAVTAAEHWRAQDECRIVGVDLAGFEDVSTRAHYFRDDFKAIHRCGLALTVHAGENDDAEGIWSAVFDLSAMRVGHALSLRQSPDLLRSVANRSLALEMCPYANFQIKGYPLDDAASASAPATRYPLLDYLRAGIRVTVNTDNLGISAATLTDNLLLAARLCPGLTRLDLLHLQRHAIEAAFLTPTERSRLLARLDHHLARA